MCEVHFIKADSSNLPEVDLFMVMEYFNKSHNFISAEMSGTKMQRSARQSYGDNAIGYVQLRRENTKCIVKGRITPEHKLNSKCYKVSCTILESKKEIEDVKCYDCAASEGGCKHSIAFLMWLHRRSEEPSPTETVCYWKKSILSGATTSKKFITTADFKKKHARTNLGDTLSEYIREATERGVKNSTLRYYTKGKHELASIYWLKNEFTSKFGSQKLEYASFRDFCKEHMTENILREVEKKTRRQSKCPVWKEMRYGRITASKAYEVVKCNTYDGVLVENILGAKFFQTEAMKRGLDLEEEVLQVLSKEVSKTFRKAGFFLSREYPMIGASPDAISDDCVVEIKSPTLERTVENYIDKEGNITLKCYYQIQMQMYLAKKNSAIFVVSDPNFEDNKKISFKTYDYDKSFVSNMLDQIIHFWMRAVFNKI